MNPLMNIARKKSTQCMAVWAVAAWLLVPWQPHTKAAGLLIAEGGFGGVLEIKQQDVKVTINNGVAVTEIDQVFLNTENRIVEALYTFPVPKDASVANFSMWINGKEMIGEVVEKKRARQIYNSYKQKRRDPGLLEQTDYKRFEMRIFPIPARTEQRVKVTYYQELDVDHDWVTLVHPLATVSRQTIDPHVTGSSSFSLETKSEVPIVKMHSPSHSDAFAIVKHTDHYYQASLETSGANLDRDLVIAYRLQRPRTGIDITTSKQPNEDGYFLLTLTAGPELERLDQGMDYVFILDISGSMAHDSKLKLSRESLQAFIDVLEPEDRFEVITFNISPNTLFNQLSEANEKTRTNAQAFLESQKARGGTVLRPAISAAYRYADPDRTLNVVILSDGLTQQREQQELLGLITQRPANARVFCIGVGNEVNRPLMQQLTQETGGLASFISHGDDFDRQAQAFRRKLSRPAVAGLNITFDGGDVFDVEPKKLPNLYHGSPVRLYGRYRAGGEVVVKVQGDVLGNPITQSINLNLPDLEDTNPQIERMWAWHQVHRLMDEARKNGSTPSLTNQIVGLCEQYSIASEYASFIVLENNGEYQRWKIKRRNAKRIQNDRRAREVLRHQLDELRSRSSAAIGPAPVGKPQVRTRAQSLVPAQAPVMEPVPSQVDPQTTRRRGWDLDLPSVDGGGAIDPVTGALVFALAAIAVANRRGKPKP